MLLHTPVGARVACSHAAGKKQISAVGPRTIPGRHVALSAAATHDASADDALDLSRRHLLLTVPAAIVLKSMLAPRQAGASEEYKTFLGYSQVRVNHGSIGSR